MTHREIFYDSLSMHWIEEKMFYQSLNQNPVQISCFEYNLSGYDNDLVLITRFDIGPWYLTHALHKSKPKPTYQIIIHNPELWKCIFMNQRCYHSNIPADNNYLIAYYNAVNDKANKDIILKRKREIFEECAQGVSFSDLPYEQCLQQLTLLQQSFNDKLCDFGRYF